MERTGRQRQAKRAARPGMPPRVRRRVRSSADSPGSEEAARREKASLPPASRASRTAAWPASSSVAWTWSPDPGATAPPSRPSTHQKGGAADVFQTEREENALFPGKSVTEGSREGGGESFAGRGAARLTGSAGPPENDGVRAAERGFPADRGNGRGWPRRGPVKARAPGAAAQEKNFSRHGVTRGTGRGNFSGRGMAITAVLPQLRGRRVRGPRFPRLW